MHPEGGACRRKKTCWIECDRVAHTANVENTSSSDSEDWTSNNKVQTGNAGNSKQGVNSVDNYIDDLADECADKSHKASFSLSSQDSGDVSSKNIEKETESDNKSESESRIESESAYSDESEPSSESEEEYTDAEYETEEEPE